MSLSVFNSLLGPVNFIKADFVPAGHKDMADLVWRIELQLSTEDKSQFTI